ncbi:MAG: CPBP family intramembrane metalloprotease [Acholeplasmataceae bacterium]|nr:CPBP family intramembrane metalloprotease [Acholeplasmataceae bacterium]
MRHNNKTTYLFVGIVFLVTWGIWSVAWLESNINTAVLVTIGTFVPSGVGLMIELMRSRSSIKNHMISAVSMNMSAKTYGLIFFTLPIVMLLSVAIMHVSGLALPDVSFTLLEFPIVFIVILVTMGPLGEEFGWRGLLLPALLKKHHVLGSSIITGLIWSLWHFPLFWMDGALQKQFSDIYGIGLALVGYTFYTLLISVLITVIYKKSDHRLSSSILIHTVANMTIGVMPLVFRPQGALIYLSLMSLAIALIYRSYKKSRTMTPQTPERI